ncbi:UNVERIFIED_CONTAM: G-type lectin S-receptor-like serine/threonine-protein kinase [Sesamum radiatum]|uniref:G-type lectin S-receptor-like serine/threonine-protein kinase n=1 Tax=Sesamum radiatum TaxID=300843 RepID=A0AAW2JZC6_SESRA
MAGRIDRGSRLLAGQDQAWVSDNGTFAFGFSPVDSRKDQFHLGIWFGQLPAKMQSWSSTPTATSFSTTAPPPSGHQTPLLPESKRRSCLKTATSYCTARSTDSMAELLPSLGYTLPGQPLTVSLELKSSKSQSDGGYYTLKMLQQPTSLSLALTYNLPVAVEKETESAYTNFSYWSGPEISNVTGDVLAVLDGRGSFGIVYGSSADGAVYVYKNDNDSGGLSSAINRTISPLVLRRLILETNGNLRCIDGKRCEWIEAMGARVGCRL